MCTPAQTTARTAQPTVTWLKALLATLLFAVSLTMSVGAGAETVRSGQITGQSDHVMTGTISIEHEGDKTFVVLSEDFSLDGAPDPKLGFGKNGAFDTDTIFAKLEALTGAQRYEVPSSVDVADYDTFTVWCEQFSVPLGSAELE